MTRLLIAVLALGLAACGTAAPEAGTSAGAEPAARTSGWSVAAASPLPWREGPAVAWTGTEVLVVGGSIRPPCPPNAACAVPAGTTAGAAYDPATDSWRRIAEAPLSVGGLGGGDSAIAGGTLVLWPTVPDRHLLAYDVARDAWRTIDVPDPAGQVRATLVGDGDRLLLVSGSDEHTAVPDRVYDVAAGTWSTLPDDPLGPTFDRVITPTPAGLVLTAKTLVDSPGSEEPALVRGALLDRDTGAWRELPVAEQIGGWQWAWTGTRMVDPQLGGGDGGRIGSWGRFVPYGGTLDPATGTWGRLPNAPDAPAGRGAGWAVTALGGRFSATEGYLYDDADGSWQLLAAPAGAPAEPGPAIWAGERLVVLGGVTWSGLRDPRATISEEVRVFAPAARGLRR